MAAKNVRFDITARDRTKAAFGRVQRGLKTLGKSVFSLRTGLAAVAGVAGIGLLVKKSLDAADAIAKTADSIGISTAALQEYRFAAGIAGVETAALDSAFGAFGKRIGELRAGTGTLVTILQKMDPALLANLKAANSTEGALRLMFKAMDGLKNQTDRAALSAAAFGRQAGVAMTNMVKRGTEALENMRQKARDLGLIIGENLLRSAEDAKDQLSILGQVLSTQVTKAVLENARAIQKLTADLIEAIPKVLEFVRALAEWFGLIKENPFGDLQKKLAAVNKQVFFYHSLLEQGGKSVEERNHFERVYNQLLVEQARLLKLVYAAAPKSGGPPSRSGPLQATVAPGGGVMVDQAKILKENAKGLKDYLGWLKKVVTADRELAATIKNEVMTPLERYTQQVATLNRLKQEGFIYSETFTRAMQREKKVLADATTKTVELSDAARDLGLVFSSAFEDAVVSGKKFSEVLKGLAQDILRVILRRTVTEPIGGFFSKMIGSILPFAHGGSIGGGQAGLVGERGPELFVPRTAGSIIPNRALGGKSIVYNIDARGSTPGVEQRIVQALRDLDRSVEPRAVRAVADARSRGGAFAEVFG